MVSCDLVNMVSNFDRVWLLSEGYDRRNCVNIDSLRLFTTCILPKGLMFLISHISFSNFLTSFILEFILKP